MPGGQIIKIVGVNVGTAITGISVDATGNNTGENFTVSLADSSGDLSATGTGVTGSHSDLLTITGSVANIIVVEKARTEAHISFVEYMKIGVPVSLITLAIGLLWLRFVPY